MSTDTIITTQNRKTVRFVLEKNQVRTFEMLHDVPSSDLWLSADDIAVIKEHNRQDCREWRKMGYSSLLGSTFAVTSTQQDHINAFVQLEGQLLYRRGLERHCSRQLSEERSACKERAREIVFTSQQHFKQEGMKYDELAYRISCAYMDECRPARIFARRFGMADETAAIQTVNPKSLAKSKNVPTLMQTNQQTTGKDSGSWFISPIRSPRRKIMPLGRRKTPLGLTNSKNKDTRPPLTSAEEFYAAIA